MGPGDDGMGGDGMEDEGGTGDGGMDGGATDMGMGDAMVTELAMARLDEVPSGPLVWAAFELPAEGEGAAPHSHGPAFAYAAHEEVRVVTGDEVRTLPQGDAAFLMADVEHSHPDGGWEVRLMAPDAAGPEDAQRVFTSGPLEGVPEAPVDARFMHVALPPGSMTSVHEHPGPEYVWVSEGAIAYQSGSDGTTQMARGDDHALPPHTPVQKRNHGEAQAAFLSLFLVDPAQPFVIDSSFG